MAAKYDASKHYRTRGYEINQKIVMFASHKITLYQRSDVHQSSWWFRLHIKTEKRQYRRSLRTLDLNEALKLYEASVLEILTKMKSGQRILALRLSDLYRRFQLHMEKRVADDLIAKRTWVSQRYRVNLGITFLKTKYAEGLETKVTSIDGEVFKDFLDWRMNLIKEAGKTLRRDVVRDDLLIIRKMFTFAKDNHWCTEKSIPTWDFEVEKVGPKRARLSSKHMNQFFNVVEKWMKAATDPKSFYSRYMLMHVVSLVGVSGMRSGEVFGLKNNDLEIRPRSEEAVINIRRETSKVRRSRTITVPLIALQHWLKRRRHNGDNDHLFSPYDRGTKDAKDVVYHQYSSLRQSLKEVGLEWIDLYHMRHWWVTNRLLAGEHIHEIAVGAGTSVAEIESTYSHVITEMSTRRMNRKQVVHDETGDWKVITRQIREISGIEQPHK
jgi:hypothetical protein